MSFILQHFNLVILLASLLHLTEEFIYPGGFGTKFKAMMSNIGVKISNRWLILTNLLFLSVVVSTFFIHNPLYVLSVVSILPANALLHIGKSVHSKGYFPGLITAVLLYIPLGLVAFLPIGLTPGLKALSFLLGLLTHGFPFIGLILYTKFLK